MFCLFRAWSHLTLLSEILRIKGSIFNLEATHRTPSNMRLVGAGRPHIKFHQICNTFLKIPNFCPLNFAVQWEIECTLNLLEKKKKVLCCLSVTLQMPSYFFSKARRLTWLIRSLFTWMVDIQCITSLSFSLSLDSLTLSHPLFSLPFYLTCLDTFNQSVTLIFLAGYHTFTACTNVFWRVCLNPFPRFLELWFHGLQTLNRVTRSSCRAI